MAKNISYKENIVQKVTLKGILSTDATTITYDDDGASTNVKLEYYLRKFAGDNVEITITKKSEKDLLES